MTSQETQTLTRWRLVLGKNAEQHGICLGAGDEQAARIDALVGFLFGDGQGGGSGAGSGSKQPPQGDRTGGLGPGPAMNVPRWVEGVHHLSPREAREVLER